MSTATLHGNIAPNEGVPPGRAAILQLGLLLSGCVLFLGAYWIWGGVLQVPLEFRPGRVTLDGPLNTVVPSAPRWIMPSITAVIGMLMWWGLAQRRHSISFVGAAATYLLACLISFVVANVCLQIGAAMQYVPRPDPAKIAALLPQMLAEGLNVLIINIVFHGIVLLPLAAISGLAVAGAVRFALWAGDQSAYSSIAITLVGILSIVSLVGAIVTSDRYLTASQANSINRPIPRFADMQQQRLTGNPNAQAPDLGPEPWAASERNAKDVREYARREALQALVQSSAPQLCEKRFRQRLMGRLGYYLEQRGMQQRGYPASWSAPGGRFVAEAWGTPDDLKIEIHMRKLYESGYFRRDRFKSSGDLLQRILGDIQPSGTLCSE